MSSETFLPQILLIEHSATDATHITEALKQVAPLVHIEWVINENQARDYLFCTGAYTQRPGDTPALILLDLNLPKATGLEILRLIKSYARFRVIPVVALSSDEVMSARAYQLGVNSCIFKPHKPEILIENIIVAGTFWLQTAKTFTSTYKPLNTGTIDTTN